MPIQRNILVIALLVVTFFIYQKWNEQNTYTNQQKNNISQVGSSKSGHIPNIDENSTNNITNQAEKLVTITTDKVIFKINLYGGDIVYAKLINLQPTGKDRTFQLLQNTNNAYIAQSGLIGKNGIDSNTNKTRPLFSSQSSNYTLKGDSLSVPITYTKDGITYIKTFIIKKDSYAVDVNYDIKNNSGTTANLAMYTQIKKSENQPSGGLKSYAMPVYQGTAYSDQEHNYKKYSFSDIKDTNLNITTNTGWIAMLQHYFVTAWVPHLNKDQSGKIYTTSNNGYAYIGFMYPSVSIPNDQSATIKSTLWIGPKIQNAMEKVAPHLNLTIDYGWLFFIAKPLHWLFLKIHSLVSNWGLVIIIFTLLVRGAMYPLTRAQYTSMAKMKMLQPKIEEMKARVGDDRQKMSQEMMALYKREKVNPLGGCLPLLIQMPIFIAFYWVLMESYQLRGAPFFGWITDLSNHDPLYILPLLMGGTMFLIQKMSPTTVTDPMQQKIMTFMPIVFTAFFFMMPSGLVLYWVTSNLATLTQQFIIFRSLEKKGLHTRKAKNKK